MARKARIRIRFLRFNSLCTAFEHSKATDLRPDRLKPPSYFVAGKHVTPFPFVLNPFDDLMALDPLVTVAAHHGTVDYLLSGTDVGVSRDKRTYGVAFQCPSASKFELMLAFDVGFLTQGDYTVAFDLFHPTVQNLTMTARVESLSGLRHLQKPIDDLTVYMLRPALSWLLPLMGHRKQVLQFRKTEGKNTKQHPRCKNVGRSLDEKECAKRLLPTGSVRRTRMAQGQRLDPDLMKPQAYFDRQEEKSQGSARSTGSTTTSTGRTATGW